MRGVCSFEEDAETQCAELIEKGLAADPKNPEALQCQASYLLVKQDTEVTKHSVSGRVGRNWTVEACVGQLIEGLFCFYHRMRYVAGS